MISSILLIRAHAVSALSADAKNLKRELTAILDVCNNLIGMASTGVPRPASPAKLIGAVATVHRGACPDCGGTVEHADGCVVCRGCGYTECG